jgi:DNA polymerase kappa
VHSSGEGPHLVNLHRTFREKSKDEDILQCLAEIAQNLEEDLKRTGFSGRTVVVKYKVSDGG